ncbi:Pentatricopeptide repeat-containing protein 1, mitochondrial [Coemansia spiralis]|uniref:Pentatricopeptide repeat-containing protein 1, mitochondrial n=1 Tax=Coemansia spiralis TaxID=417178 RepID=A0A9W8GA30_9FUNG|nr:Pentatricopeptide repeat-containing protein 1, mitochondrial [Coemansia spiralis]
MGQVERQGGYDRGAGMHLSVPLRAKNIEKAWDICIKKLQRDGCLVNGDTLKSEAVEVILLMAKNAGARALSPDGAGAEDGAATDKGWHALFGFRAALILKHVFSDPLSALNDERSASGDLTESGGGIDVQSIDWRLGLSSVYDYKGIISLLCAAIDPCMPVGNTPELTGATPGELAVDIMSATVPRLMHLTLLAAQQDGVTLKDKKICAALETTVAMQDVAAARDILLLRYPDLAMLLDPDAKPSTSQATKTILDDPTNHRCRLFVKLLLELVMVGSDPRVLDAASQSIQPQAEFGYDQFEDVLRPRDDSVSPSDLDAVRQWRAETAERIYRAYVASGMSEVPSPDRSKAPALQRSVVPTPQILVTLLSIHCDAGNIEQATILYDTLVATLQSRQKLAATSPTENSNHVTRYAESSSSHKMVISYWAKILDSVSRTQQQWLATRVLGDIVADGWCPSEEMYEQYLGMLSNPSTGALAEAVGEILKLESPGGGSVRLNKELIEPLVSALVCPRVQDLSDSMSARIEQALVLSGLATGTGSCGSAVSDATARKILSAMISNNQISRAQELAELWSRSRPEIVTKKSIAELILGLANTGEYAQALEVFANFQESGDHVADLGILCAVLQVYVYAGDFEEAVSVSKRIRAMVKESKEGGVELEMPGHDVFNCMLRAYCEESLVSDAMHVVEEMRSYGLHATPDTYTVLMNTMSTLRSYDGLKLVSALAHVDYNMVPIGNRDSTQPPGSMAPTPPLPLTASFYNSLIEAYGRVAEPIKALQVWEVMRSRGIKPDNVTATLLIDMCGWNERVHWDDDMDTQTTFVEHEIPEDHVYTGMPFFHMHFLASTLQELQEAGLEFSMANYRHLLEALIRGGFLEEALEMVIGKHEDAAQKAAWMDQAKVLLVPSGGIIYEGLMSLAKRMGDQKKETKEPWAKFMDFSLDIPLCQETINTIYGMIGAVRFKCTTDENADACDMPFVQNASPNLLKRLALHEQRLDEFLQQRRPDLLPNDRSPTATH